MQKKKFLFFSYIIEREYKQLNRAKPRQTPRILITKSCSRKWLKTALKLREENDEGKQQKKSKSREREKEREAERERERERERQRL